MSKILEPTALATAMSPCPARATETEASASGTEVPAASTRVPITALGYPERAPDFRGGVHHPVRDAADPHHGARERHEVPASFLGAEQSGHVHRRAAYHGYPRSRIIRADGESRVARESDGFSSAAVSSSARTDTSATGTNAAWGFATSVFSSSPFSSSVGSTREVHRRSNQDMTLALTDMNPT